MREFILLTDMDDSTVLVRSKDISICTREEDDEYTDVVRDDHEDLEVQETPEEIFQLMYPAPPKEKKDRPAPTPTPSSGIQALTNGDAHMQRLAEHA